MHRYRGMVRRRGDRPVQKHRVPGQPKLIITWPPRLPCRPLPGCPSCCRRWAHCSSGWRACSRLQACRRGRARTRARSCSSRAAVGTRDERHFPFPSPFGRAVFALRLAGLRHRLASCDAAPAPAALCTDPPAPPCMPISRPTPPGPAATLALQRYTPRIYMAETRPTDCTKAPAACVDGSSQTMRRAVRVAVQLYTMRAHTARVQNP